MATRTIQMNDSLYEYFLANSLREDPVLLELREETARLYPKINMQIAPEQGQFLSFLIRIIQAKRVLEIGVFTGYSSLWMAKALPKEGSLIACDVSKEWTKIAQKYWNQAGVSEKIQLHLNPALKTLENLETQFKDQSKNQSKDQSKDREDSKENKLFDLVFIDANKEDYPLYYEKSLALLKEGGIIAVDNVFWSGRVADSSNQERLTQIIRDFNQKLHSDTRIELSILPIADGLTLAQKKPKKNET